MNNDPRVEAANAVWRKLRNCSGIDPSIAERFVLMLDAVRAVERQSHGHQPPLKRTVDDLVSSRLEQAETMLTDALGLDQSAALGDGRLPTRRMAKIQELIAKINAVRANSEPPKSELTSKALAQAVAFCLPRAGKAVRDHDAEVIAEDIRRYLAECALKITAKEPTVGMIGSGDAYVWRQMWDRAP